MILKLAIGCGLVLVTSPAAFLFGGVLASVMPPAGAGITLALTGLLYIAGAAFLARILTEKLSKRWSR